MQTTITRKPMCKSSLPLYVDERPFSIDIPTPGAEAEPTKKTISFVELRVKQEYFVVSPSRPDFEVCKSEVLQNQGDGLVKYHVEEEKAEGEKGNEGLSSSPEEETEAFALAVETQPTSINTIKCVNRVVLVNHRGDRVRCASLCRTFSASPGGSLEPFQVTLIRHLLDSDNLPNHVVLSRGR